MTHVARSLAPVFVVGSPRSGTTLLYHMLLSAGGFARYRTETHVFNTLAPRFGGLHRRGDIEDALRVWLASDCHTLSGLDAETVSTAIRRDVTNAGGFLSAIMNLMVERQGATRWAETTPAHLLHLQEITEQIPGALFIHVIRDGRDVAASLEKQQWIRPFAIDRSRPILAAAAYWDWIVQRGRAAGARAGASYCEVRYEALVDDLDATLRSLEAFLEHPLDREAIQRAGIGSVGKPNTSFPNAKGGFHSRWKSQLTPDDARDVDAILAPTLRMLGYAPEADSRPASLALRAAAYHSRFAVRDWVKRSTPVGRLATDLSHFSAGSMTVTDEKLDGVVGGAAAR